MKQYNFSHINDIDYQYPPENTSFDPSFEEATDREVIHKVYGVLNFCDTFKGICNTIHYDLKALDRNIKLIYDEMKESQRTFQESIQGTIQESIKTMENSIISRFSSLFDRQFSKEKQFITEFAQAMVVIGNKYLGDEQTENEKASNQNTSS